MSDLIIPVGAILGDVVGSRFEGRDSVSKDFKFIHRACYLTDDTVMTIAVLKAVREWKKDPTQNLRELAVYYMHRLGRRYLWAGYGEKFSEWLFSDKPEPYGSYGNGAAMRVSPCGWYADDFSEALSMAEAVTDVTHNHPDAVQGAKAVAGWIYLARQGMGKQEIYDRLVSEGLYVPAKTVDRGVFDITCKGTVNTAIHCLMKNDSFEDILRDAVCYGGDTDTNACIACSMAEPLYPIPENLKEFTLNNLRYRRSDGIEEVMLYNILYDIENDYEKEILDGYRLM